MMMSEPLISQCPSLSEEISSNHGKCCNTSISCTSDCKAASCCGEENGLTPDTCQEKSIHDNPCVTEKEELDPPRSLLQQVEVDQPSTTIHCFAVVQNHGREVDLFDAEGKHKTFSMVSPTPSTMESKKICFSSHGVVGKDGMPIDGLLTPCLDEHGLHISLNNGNMTNHISSESSSSIDLDCAVCDVKTAHLHAHIHDPVTCSMDYSSRSSSSITTHAVEETRGDPNADADWNFLASLTFMEKEMTLHSHDHSHGDSNLEEKEEDVNTDSHQQEHHRRHSMTHSNHSHPDPTHDHNHPDDIEPETPITARLPITESLPKECNSKEFSKRLNELDEQSSSVAMLRDRRVLSKVQHEDHIDILVHNNRTGNLHLEHPCNTCGENDFHGKLDLVGTRSVVKEGGNFTAKKVHVHFFEPPTKPFRMVDLLSDVFDLNSPNRVAAVREMSSCIQRNSSQSSSFRNSNHSLVLMDDEEKQSSASVLLPPSSKQSSCCSYGSCGMRSFLPQEILCNASSSSVQPSAKDNLQDNTTRDRSMDSTAVRSQFYVQGICCSSETKQILAILEPLEGVQSVRVNAQLKSVVVEHDPRKVPAVEIQKILNRERFMARITEDGEMTANRGTPKSLHQEERDASPEDARDHQSRKRSQFFVENICCASEIPPIRKILDSVEGVHEVSINVTTKMVYVRHDVAEVDASDIELRLNKEGFRTKTIFDAAQVPRSVVELESLPHTSVTKAESVEESIEVHASKLNIVMVVSGLFWIISMLSYIGKGWHYLKYLGIISVVCSSPPIAMKAYRTLYRRQFDVNCMMILAIIGATALQDFEEAAAVAFLFSISEWLETKATSRARTALSAIVSLRPDFAYLIDDSRDAIVRVPASALFVGAKVSVRQGDKIPCDGIIVQGASSVDESSITGESRPIRKTTGDQVSGGTINCGLTQIVVSVTATVDDSAVSKLIRLVEDAQMNRSPTEMMVDAFAKCYTPFVVLLSLCMITIPWAWGKAVGRTWMRHGLITIVLACPCALVISTPVTYVAALAATAQKGILVKGGAFLEALGRVRKVCMDKTGTLTEGNFSLDFFEPIGDRFTRIQVLEYLACVEAHASHPIASALVAAAESEGVDVRKAAIMSQQSTNIEGLGVSAVVNGLTIHAGNVELFKRLGIYSDLPAALLQSAERWKLNGGSLGFISVSGHGIVGAYSVSDKVRSEAKSVVTALFESGITVCMLTGDNHTAAHSIGQQVGIDSDCIKSQLLPQEKLDFIRKMKEDEPSNSSKQSFFSFLNCFRRRLCRIQRGLVLMIGDGVNDGPALAAADVGVSMGKGAALAIETSDITLMDSNLEKLLYSLKMGWRVRMVILQNIIFSIVTKTIVVVLVFVGYGSLWLAISSDVVAMLLVTANGMRLLPSARMVTDIKFELSDKVTPPV